MGLALSIGNPCTGLDPEGEARYREQFSLLRQELREHGYDWQAPDGPPPTGVARDHVRSYPYSYLHYLRRVYALDFEQQPVTPVTGPADLDSAAAYVRDASSMLSSHLLCHSDAEGYYVPVPLDEPLFLSQEIAGGGIVGSSEGLLDELTEIASLIGVRLEPDGTLSDAEAARMFNSNTNEPYEVEQIVWLSLHESCRASIASGHAIVFC